jgi:NADP-dependent 3-hydroxy acid dehydrogenase YdfG
MSPPQGSLVLVTGAAGPAGSAACRALIATGARVVAVGHSPARLSALAAAIPGISVEVTDLSDASSVTDLAVRVHENHGAVDSLVHLVGGYRGGATFGANTDEDWRFLSSGLIDTLRHVTLAFHDDLLASSAGRAVIVSARGAQAPSAGSANYSAAKAAAEAWMLALADSLRRGQSGRSENPVEQTSAATIFVIKALVDAKMRAESPDRKFPGFTDVDDLATRIVGLWSSRASEINGARIPLDT